MTKSSNAISRRRVLAGLAAAPLLKTAQAKDKPKSGSGATFTVEAKPASLSMNVADTAVVVIDMQNDFGSKGGMFDLAGIDISGIQRAVAPTGRVLASARRAGMKIVYLKMGYRPDLSDLGAADSVNRARHMRLNVGKEVQAPDGRKTRILIRDTWGTDIVADLAPNEHDIVMYKSRFSGFYETNLHATLTGLGIKHLIFTGCTTSICVESTVRDAMFRDYLPVLLADCTSEPIGDRLARSNHEASLLSVEVLLGWISNSDQFIAALQTAADKQPA